MTVKYETMPDGSKARVEYMDKSDNEVNTIYQKIVGIYANEVAVISNRGKIYNVMLSDKVRMTMDYRIGDWAVIKTFEEKWIVVDIGKDREVEVDVEKQMNEIMDLIGD